MSAHLSPSLLSVTLEIIALDHRGQCCCSEALPKALQVYSAAPDFSQAHPSMGSPNLQSGYCLWSLATKLKIPNYIPYSVGIIRTWTQKLCGPGKFIRKAPQLGQLLWLSFSLRHKGTMLTQGLVTFDFGRNPHSICCPSRKQGCKSRRHVIKFF